MVLQASPTSPSGLTTPRRWRALLLAYRLLLIAAAVALLWQLPWADLARFWETPPAADETARLAFVVLALASCATAVLALNYPLRPHVSLLPLPVALAWWQLGGGAATLLAGFGALFGNALRRTPLLTTVSGAARLTVAVAGGLAGAALIDAPAATVPLSARWLAGAASFMVAVGVADGLLDWLESHLSDAAARGRWRWGSAPAVAVTRTDIVLNLLILPLAALLQLVSVTFGFESLAVVLGGLLALLLVVRTYNNLRTLHEELKGLHHAVAEEREKLATLFAHSGEGIYTVDDALRLISVNPAMAELLGRKEAELDGQACAEAYRFEDELGQRLCPDRCPLRQAQSVQRPVSLEVVYQVPERPPKHLLLTYAAVGEPEGPLHLGIGIARDVTAQREALRLRDEFVSLVTHELRNPLTTSVGYLDMLKQALRRGVRGKATDAKKMLYFSDQIESSERHLLRLVNNLLDLGRVERPDLPVEQSEIALQRLISEVMESMRPLTAAKQQRLRLDMRDTIPLFWSSELYLREILGNLLSNAVKYTPDTGEIEVTVCVRPPADGPERTQDARSDGRQGIDGGDGPRCAPWVEIAVTDTGYGISDEDQARLFTRFFRSGRPEVRMERGTGLGLALTKSMVERLGGRIEVRSALGEGSTFTVSLLLAPAPRVADERVAAASDAAGGESRGRT